MKVLALPIQQKTLNHGVVGICTVS